MLERSPALPNVPTSKEAGLEGYQVSPWNAIFAPKSTPTEIVKQLNDAFVTALDDENTKKRLLDARTSIRGLRRRASTGPRHLGTVCLDAWESTGSCPAIDHSPRISRLVRSHVAA
jgi:hypothetical protein